jgi:hypothetical protein
VPLASYLKIASLTLAVSVGSYFALEPNFGAVATNVPTVASGPKTCNLNGNEIPQLCIGMAVWRATH